MIFLSSSLLLPASNECNYLSEYFLPISFWISHVIFYPFEVIKTYVHMFPAQIDTDLTLKSVKVKWDKKSFPENKFKIERI